MESREHQLDQKAAETCALSRGTKVFRERLQLQDSPWNFTLSLSAPGPTSAASVFSFPSWVLAIGSEVGIRVANDTKWGKERPAKTSSSTEVLLLILQDGQAASGFLRCSLRFTGASWANEHGQGRKAWLPQPRPRGLLVSQGLVTAQWKPGCLKGREMSFLF